MLLTFIWKVHLDNDSVVAFLFQSLGFRLAVGSFLWIKKCRIWIYAMAIRHKRFNHIPMNVQMQCVALNSELISCWKQTTTTKNEKSAVYCFYCPLICVPVFICPLFVSLFLFIIIGFYRSHYKHSNWFETALDLLLSVLCVCVCAVYSFLCVRCRRIRAFVYCNFSGVSMRTD